MGWRGKQVEANCSSWIYPSRTLAPFKEINGLGLRVSGLAGAQAQDALGRI